MQFANAVKKLQKLGFMVMDPKDPNYPQYAARILGKHVSIHFYKDVVTAELEKPLLGNVFLYQNGIGRKMSFGKAIKLAS